MKALYQVSLCLFSILVLDLNIFCQADILEVNDISSVITYATPESLYVFDLDNTLIEPRQHLGSDQWVSYMLDRLVKQGKSMREALDQVIPCYVEVIEKTEMKLVDSAATDLLDKLKKKHISHIGLTKRDPRLANRTLEQLGKLSVTFLSPVALEEGYRFEQLEGTVYKQGVVFVSLTKDKGSALCSFLKKMDKLPSHLVVIDDKMSHLTNIAAAVEPLGILFTGIRYAGADDNVKTFNPQIAEVQLEHFRNILSDEEALQLLQTKTNSKK